MKRTVFLAFIIFANAASAQQATVDTTELVPVEVRATRAGTKAPFTKTNLRRSDVESRNLGQDLPFLLAQTPSVVATSDAGNGVGYTYIRIRGTDATRINVTLNGVPFNDPESQGAFFVNLPDFASSASSVQVQRGVGTSSNGAGAFGATINLSTTEQAAKPYAELNNSYGSFNTLKNTLRLGTGKVGEYFSFDARLSNVRSDGYIDRAETDLKSYFASAAFAKGNTSLRLNVFSGKEKTYQAWNGIPEADLKLNRRMNYSGTEKEGVPYDNETDNYVQDHYQLFWNQKFSSNLEWNTGVFYIKGRGYYEQYKAEEAYADYGIPLPQNGAATTDLVRQLWLSNEFYGNVFSLLYRNAKTEATFGGAVTKYNGNHFGDVIWAQNGLAEPAFRWYNLNAWKNDATVYAKWQEQVRQHFYIYTDLQLRSVRYRIDGFRNNPALRINNCYVFFNPKAGVSYIKGAMQAYASYGVAQKEPNRDDFEAGALRQPKHEILHDLELGVERKEKSFNYGLTAYYMRYKNQLVLTGQINDVGAYTRTNIDRSYRLGLELQGAVRIAKWADAGGNITLSRNKVLDFTEYVDDYDNGGQQTTIYKKADIAFSPALTGAGQLTLKPVANFFITLTGKYVGRQYLDNTQQLSRSLDGYYTQDAQLRYEAAIKGWKGLSLIAQFNNVFNKMYVPNGYTFSYFYETKLTTENYYYPMAGFNFMFGVQVQL